MRKFAVFDIDGTLIRWQLYHALADELARRGHLGSNDYRIMKDARMAWKRRTEASFRDYELEVIRVYEKILQTLNFDDLEEAISSVFDEYKDQVYTYSRELIKKLKAEKYFLLAISGSQEEIVQLIADHYGFDDFTATTYERKGTKFSGNKKVPAHYKDKALKALVDKHGLGWPGSIAIGDSLSDAAMLELVDEPIAFNPEERLFDHAKGHHWKIVVERKNVIYQLEWQDGRYQLVKTSG